MKTAAAAAVALIISVGCAAPQDGRATPRASPSRPTAGATAPPTAPATTARTTASPRSLFEGNIAALDAQRRIAMTPSAWREGCPVPLDDLRLLRMSHRTPGGGTARGELVVHADVAAAVLSTFERIYDAGFPITRMRPIEHYEGSDDRSMNDDNTSAFNCRVVKGTTRWSEHSYGRAIDINPFENPWVGGSEVDPPGAAAYADRGRDDARMIRRQDAVWDAFAAIGWHWGGDWSGTKDYQHFSASGR